MLRNRERIGSSLAANGFVFPKFVCPGSVSTQFPGDFE
jgi:hypothetical protein